MQNLSDFRFGLETEFLLANRKTYDCLWYKDLNFVWLNSILEQISLEEVPALDGLDLEPPHRRLMPYVVEGYHLPDMDFKALDILPKGVEIRTPVCGSIAQCLSVHRLLFNRLQEALADEDLIAIALSHHPTEHHFSGPQNKRRHDYWVWAMEVMTTYGPDINIALPANLTKKLDLEDLLFKINYYAGALTAFSVASPFYNGKAWMIRGSVGKSLRTYRRSIIAPPLEVHLQENNRLELKVFEMSNQIHDYECYFLLFLALLLDPTLKGRSSNASRIYDMGAVALKGWDVPEMVERATELLQAAERSLPQWGFSVQPLVHFFNRLDSRRTPADEMIDRYKNENENIKSLLPDLSRLYP